MKKHPDKFAFLVTLPVPEVEDALAEIADAMDVLDAWGVMLPTNTKGIYMGDPLLEPVFTELNKRGLWRPSIPTNQAAFRKFQGQSCLSL